MIKAFRALKYRNFRLFFPGLIVSQVGIWMQSVAVAWLVYDLTKSPFAMGSIMCVKHPLEVLLLINSTGINFYLPYRFYLPCRLYL